MHKDSRFMREHPVALIALIITVVCLAAGLSTGVSGFLGGKEGISGYISTWAWRLGVSFAALSAAAYIVVRGMNANKAEGTEHSPHRPHGPGSGGVPASGDLAAAGTYTRHSLSDGAGRRLCAPAQL